VQQAGRVQTGKPRSNDGNSRVGHNLVSSFGMLGQTLGRTVQSWWRPMRAQL